MSLGCMTKGRRVVFALMIATSLICGGVYSFGIVGQLRISGEIPTG